MADDFAKILDDTKYEYVGPLGSGAFGVIIRARHVPLDVPVAIKILHVTAASNVDAVERFRIEAQSMSRLSGHPNIVEVLDYGVTQDGRPFLSMRFLEGRSLAEEIQERGTIPAVEAVGITLDVLAALGAAHELSVVHRDVKPANIFLAKGPNGARVVKLVDFGIAKVVQGNAALTPRSRDTTEGTLMGSPAYFAPEQALGKMFDIDPRTDIYAVGGVLFRMLTGSVLFPRSPGLDDHQGLLALMRAHVTKPPPHLSERSELEFSSELDAVIQKALAKARPDRHASAAAFAAALRAIDPETLVAAPPPPPTQRISAPQPSAIGKTARIDDFARAQALDRLRQESGWNAAPAPLPKGTTEPMGPRHLPITSPQHAPTRPAPQPAVKNGFSLRAAALIALVCGLAIAAAIIVLLDRFR